MSSKPHPGRGRAKKHEEEEHENHERWLVSYADMVTLLMCLFIVLFAISQVDKAKFAALSQGLSASFGAPITALPGTTRCCWATAGATARAVSATPRRPPIRKIEVNLVIALSYRPLEANQRFQAWS